MEAHVAPISTEPPGRRREIGLGTSSDERLARLVASGSEAAFATLYDRYHQCLFRYCRSLVHNDVDAQDALQSTFAAAYAALTRCEKDIVLRPWLFRIAHNESISLLRRRRPCEELPEITDDASGTLQERLEQRQQLEFLITDLRELPDQQRGALLMRELSGLPYEEIATALSTSTGSIKRAIFDARHALCELREGRDMACDDVCRMVSNSDRRLLRGRRIRGHLRAVPLLRRLCQVDSRAAKAAACADGAAFAARGLDDPQPGCGWWIGDRRGGRRCGVGRCRVSRLGARCRRSPPSRSSRLPPSGSPLSSGSRPPTPERRGVPPPRRP